MAGFSGTQRFLSRSNPGGLGRNTQQRVWAVGKCWNDILSGMTTAARVKCHIMISQRKGPHTESHSAACAQRVGRKPQIPKPKPQKTKAQTPNPKAQTPNPKPSHLSISAAQTWLDRGQR